MPRPPGNGLNYLIMPKLKELRCWYLQKTWTKLCTDVGTGEAQWLKITVPRDTSANPYPSSAAHSPALPKLSSLPGVSGCPQCNRNEVRADGLQECGGCRFAGWKLNFNPAFPDHTKQISVVWHGEYTAAVPRGPGLHSQPGDLNKLSHLSVPQMGITWCKKCWKP